MRPPAFAPFPTSEIRQQIAVGEWSGYIQTWILASQIYLLLPTEDFARFTSTSTEEGKSLVTFLTTYLVNIDQIAKDHDSLELRKNAFLLLHRIFNEVDRGPEQLLDCTALGAICKTYRKISGLEISLLHVWSTHQAQIESSLVKVKTDLIEYFELDDRSTNVEKICSNTLIPLIRVVPPVGAFFVAGADFMDGLAAYYRRAPLSTRRMLLKLSYLCLTSPFRQAKPNLSLTYDQLYNLSALGTSGDTSLLPDIISETPLLSKLKKLSEANPNARATKLQALLEPLRAPSKGILGRRHGVIAKGKAKVHDKSPANDLSHIHRVGLISQVQDIFPDLGSGFIARLLDEYEDQVESVTAALLENSLPPHLQQLDRSQTLAHEEIIGVDGEVDLAPRSTPPPSIPERRNVFDGDEFDRLAIDESRIHKGKGTKTADSLSLDRTNATNKAAILSALAAFDSDDDERDDTYDLEDVGGTVDSSRVGVEDVEKAKEDPASKNENALFAAYRKDQGVFQRDALTRRSEARTDLKRATDMTDEAIEGWALMLSRDPRRLRRLEGKYASFTGQEQELGPSSWGRLQDSATEDSEASGAESSRRTLRGRGGRPTRGRGQGRGGGNASGPSSDPSIQKSREGKEQHKSSRANHNRRDQRARKMARAGFPG